MSLTSKLLDSASEVTRNEDVEKCLVDVHSDTSLNSASRLVRNLDWNLIQTFASIAANRGVTRAGVELMRTQPAISAALKRLEVTLSISLINRNCSEFSLTREGRDIYHLALQINDLMRQVCSIATNQFKGATRKIYVASNVVLPNLQEVILSQMMTQNEPEFEIAVLGPSEFASTIHSDPNAWFICSHQESGHGSSMILVDEFDVGVFVADRLAEVLRATPDRFDRIPWIVVDGAEQCSGLRSILDMQYDAVGHQMATSRASSFSLAADIARAGMGITVIPVPISSSQFNYQGLVNLTQFGTGKIQTYLSTRKNLDQLTDPEREFVRSINQQRQPSNVSRLNKIRRT